MKKTISTRISTVCVLLVALSLVFSACAPAPTPAPTQDVDLIQTQSAQTVVADLTQNAPPSAAATATLAPPGPTPDPNIPVAVLPTADPSGPSAVANYNTTIFSGPGTDYVVYGSFLGSQTAVIIGKSEDDAWWAISVPVAPGGAGWVSADWVTATNADNVEVLASPPVPPTTDLVPPGASDPQATTLANTYVRTGPAVNYPAYGIAKTGATGRVIGKSEDGLWWAVRLDPANVGVGYGWVSGQYVQTSNTAEVQTIENPETHTVVTPEPPASGAPAATTTEYVNVRTGPGTNYPVLVVAPPGATGEVTGKSSDAAWWQVKIPTQYAADGFGWVSAGYVTTQNTGSVPVAAAPPAPPTVVPTPPAVSGSCALVSQTPADGTTIGIDTPFNTTWVLQNTGADRWDESQVDARYLGAKDNVQLHTGADLYDLDYTVQPGQTYNFTVAMIAPFNAGSYGEAWEIVQGNRQLCQFFVYINVP